MRFIKSHLEWVVFAIGLILLGSMDPATSATSFCIYDLLGIDFCPGDGLGHSIAYTFRGEFGAAFEAHFAGPAAVIILSCRIVFIWRQLYTKSNQTNTEELSWQK